MFREPLQITLKILSLPGAENEHFMAERSCHHKQCGDGEQNERGRHQAEIRTASRQGGCASRRLRHSLLLAMAAA